MFYAFICILYIALHAVAVKSILYINKKNENISLERKKKIAHYNGFLYKQFSLKKSN